MYKEHKSLFKYVPINITEDTISKFSDEQLVNLHNDINRINEINKEYFNVNLQPSNSPSLINQEQVTSPPTNVTASTQAVRRSSRTRRPVIPIDSETKKQAIRELPPNLHVNNLLINQMVIPPIFPVNYLPMKNLLLHAKANAKNLLLVQICHTRNPK